MAWLIDQFSGETDMCYHFILPVRVSNLLKKVKLDIISSLKHMHSLITPVIKYFDPILPRKYLTVLLIGSWKQILTGKAKLLNEIKRQSGYEEMEQFFSFVNAQMYRHIFKNSAKFIHAIEKWLIPNFNQNEMKKVYILKFWDVYSAEVISPGGGGNPIEEFRTKVMGHLYQDTDTMLNLIRLCASEAQVRYLLQNQFKITVEETLRKSCLFYGNFCKEFESRGKHEYFNFYLDGISNQLIDNSEEEDFMEEDQHKMLDKIIDEVRRLHNTKKFTVFPASYGTDIDMNSWNATPDSKIFNYLHNLENRKFILGSENHVNQIIGSAQVLPEVKETADIMIGCDKNPSNFLYIFLADKAEASQRFI